jgi:Mlc titration factor MtfA (ptsG expression regulator)
LRGRAASWQRAMQSEYQMFRAAVDRGEETFLDPYAAEDESEFFAVVTEDFIECGVMLREAHPTLYALMREFYGIDPAAWATSGHSHA